MILYVNACVRNESRTDRIAKALLEKLCDESNLELGDYEEVHLESADIQPLRRETLAKRDAFVESGDFTDPMFDYAKQFAGADTIVIAAPFWDFSIPALLRIYLENIYVVGLTSEYNEQGLPHGLCKAKKLYFVTTAGGPLFPQYGYNYVKDLAQQAFGIPEVELIKAENLDIIGNNPDAIVEESVKSLHEI